MRLNRLSVILVASVACRSAVPLIETSTLAPGIECPNGGVSIQTGNDEDRDGILDDDELVDEEVICSGAPGADGANGVDGDSGINGETPLISVTASAPTAECCWGGTTVAVGFDADDDDALDPEEISTSELICDPNDGTPAAAIAGCAPELEYSANEFIEGVTEGEIASPITVEVSDGRFSDFAVLTGTLAEGADFELDGAVPTGLSLTVTVLSPTSAEIRLDGAALSSADEDDVTGLTLTWSDAVFATQVGPVDGSGVWTFDILFLSTPP